MKASKKKTVTILMAMSHYVASTHYGIAKYARIAGWELISAPSTSNCVEGDWNADGIIGNIGRKDSKISTYFLNAKIPKVSIHTDCILPGVPRVIPDNAALGREAARELLNIGMNHLAFFTLNTESQVVRERLTGFKEEVQKAKKNFVHIDLTPNINRNEPAEKIAKFLRTTLNKLPHPIGIGSQFDLESNCIAKAVINAGLSIPDDVSIVGIDNDPIETLAGPVPLTSVDASLELQGYRAAEVLDGLLHGKKPSSMTVRIPIGSVWRRQSTDRFSVEDKLISQALLYINKNFHLQIEVEDIVRACSTSRSILFSRFKSILNTSPKQELLRIRMQHAKKLLSTTDHKIETIATETGFVSSRTFLKIFKQHTKHTPTYFRSIT